MASDKDLDANLNEFLKEYGLQVEDREKLTKELEETEKQLKEAKRKAEAKKKQMATLKRAEEKARENDKRNLLLLIGHYVIDKGNEKFKDRFVEYLGGLSEATRKKYLDLLPEVWPTKTENEQPKP